MTKEQARAKAKALVAQMTAEEKMSQLLYNSPAIERLGIKEYNWWNEGAHGVARAGTATVFPHTIAMAATFDPELINKIADVISTEGRAKYNKHVKYGDHDIFKGLTFWAPNINIFRDPRWGRGQETFGECPYLTATLGTAFIKGIQGDGEFLKASACSKHFAVHSGPEADRHGFDAIANPHDLFETYLPAFEKTVKAGVTGVMGAYNRTNGEPCCAHSYLLGEILRKQWEFDGYVVSDCGAIRDIYAEHHFTETKAEAAAVSLKNTCDLNCGETYTALIDAYEQDLITEEDITVAAERVYTIRFLLGEFEEVRPYSDIGFDKLDCKEHKALNLRAAEQCVVLLKNKDAFLPLSKENIGKIAVVGPNSLSVTALEGNYNAYASEYITVADGIRRVFTDSTIMVEKGSNYCDEYLNHWSGFQNMISDGVAAASEADITVLALGLDCSIEGEDTGFDNDYTACGDKKSLGLPKTQQKLAEAVCDVCENVIVVLMCGSSIDLGEKVTNHAKAILHAWYPGSQGGLAVANILSGKVSPCGKLPVTIYGINHNLPDFKDYSMQGKTYRYIEGDALYPFGYGLSYTSFAYENAKAEKNGDKISVTVEIANTGKVRGTEKTQVYASFTDSRTVTPHYQLCAIRSVELDAGEKSTVTFDIDGYWIKAVTAEGERVDPDGKIFLYVGGQQPDSVSKTLLGTECIKIEL